VRCGSCEVTQALLPWFVLNRRWDEVEVIGRAGRRGGPASAGAARTQIRS